MSRQTAPLSRRASSSERCGEATVIMPRRRLMAACLELLRRVVRSLQLGAWTRPSGPVRPGNTRSHQFIDEMTHEQLLAELVAEHNATLSPGAWRLSDGDLRMLLKFERWRAWTTRHGRPHAARGESRRDWHAERARPGASE